MIFVVMLLFQSLIIQFTLTINITNKKYSKTFRMNQQQQNQTSVVQSQNSLQKHHQSVIEKSILDLNKHGLKHLTEGNFDQALQYFKKSQKMLIKQITTQQSDCKLIQLLGITYNNLACYNKKTKRPKVALKYLKKALQLQVFKLNNWTSIAGTHLNICAIFSYMKNHQQACSHAQLAIQFLQKVQYQTNDQSQQAKSYWNVYMLSYYNLAIQKQYLKQLEQALKHYKKAKQIAQQSGKKYISIIISCDQSISRLQPMIQNLRKKMIETMKKKQQANQKGYADYIRLNKKNYNFKKQIDPQNGYNEQKIVDYLNKIQLYNETPTTTAGNRFRTRKILNNSIRDNIRDNAVTQMNKRTKSLSAFNNRLSSNIRNQQRKVRLYTQNDTEEDDLIRQNQQNIRNQQKQLKEQKYERHKVFRKSNNVSRQF